MNILFDGRKLRVEYEFTPGSPGSRDEPPTDDEIIVNRAWLIGPRRARRISDRIIDNGHDKLRAAIREERKTLDYVGRL